MLKKLWRWLVGTSGPSRTDVLLEILIENQQKTTQAVMNAVAQIGEASSKQAEVLSQYLKLFQTPGEPQRWTEDMEQDNKDELLASGFPAEASEEEQAKWVLNNLDRL